MNLDRLPHKPAHWPNIHSASTFAAAIMVIGICGCRKEDDTPASPVITLHAISDQTVSAFSNAVQITFDYEDFQGDIGHEDPDTYALRVRDERLEGYDWYHIPPLTPDQQELHVKGRFSVTLRPLFLLGEDASETTRFTLQVRDRAGNWSNQIMTPAVTITE